MGRPAMLRQHEWSEHHDSEVIPLMVNLHRAQALAFSQAKAVWARHGLTPAEFDVLASLRNAPHPHELTPSELQEAVLITSGGLSKVMRQLEEKGLATRPHQEFDQRVKPVKLTLTGRRTVEKAMAELAAGSGAWVRTLFDRREIALLSELLGRMADAKAYAHGDTQDHAAAHQPADGPMPRT